ncbi:MAG: phosphoribosylpyrophosphate synthetase [Saprospiraceae bacterium]
MDTVEQYDTLTDAINSLRSQGYTEDFNLQTSFLDCRQGALQVHPHEFEIDKLFRFFGPSDPDDESILYAISSSSHALKGILVDGFGTSSDSLTQDMIEKLGKSG